jgi:HD-GYP domain-containing protein (c-di-GMP phosphodiesterase class II)
MTNARLRELLKELDEHAPGEAEHGERVAVYSVAIGEKMGMDGTALERLRFASALHDFGKLGLPSELLTSAEALTDTETAELRVHPTWAAAFLMERGVPAYEGILAHHERWDGSGYPLGLCGEEIPLEGRIIAVAETFDILNYGAPWQTKKTETEALDIVRHAAGSHFDPAVVEALLLVQPLIQPVGT